jgi:hypothetical protein
MNKYALRIIVLEVIGRLVYMGLEAALMLAYLTL